MTSSLIPNSRGVFEIPESQQCGISLTFDTDMAAGYSPLERPGCHGRTAPFVAEQMRRLMDIAEEFDVRLHWFMIANGLENGCDWAIYREALARGHDVDSHTYNHINLGASEAVELDADLRLANIYLWRRLGVEPMILRGPGGYPEGALRSDVRKVIMDNGFRFVSGQSDASFSIDRKAEPHRAITDPETHPPFEYPDGLIEIPFHGWTDRTWFDVLGAKDTALQEWRKQWGHRAVASNWKCPWSSPDSLDRFIEFHKSMFDYAYERRLLVDCVFHPYTLYLHDRENRLIRDLLGHVRSKQQPVWIGTLRDAAGQLMGSGTMHRKAAL